MSNRFCNTLSALMPAIGLLLITSPLSAQEFTIKDLNVVQRPMANLRPQTQSDLHISAWVNHGNSTYAFGENVMLSVKSNRDAYLTIVDVGTSGKVHIIFPNQYQTNNRIRAGKVLQIPDSRANFDFKVGPPTGRELIKIFASPDAAPLIKPGATQPAGPFKALKATAPTVAKDLDTVLRQSRHRQWTGYNKVINIVPR